MSGGRSSDLLVDRLSEALAGRTLDVVVSGSIGAVESVRFVRALRRLGAEVVPWLTEGGARFITPTSLAWAAGRDVRTDFTGDASHIALADACIVTPASASLIGRVAQGLTDTPAAALVASYLGMGRPVLLLPNMHESLANSPAVRRNVETLHGFGVIELTTRDEEGKRKFPEPALLADTVAHLLNRARTGLTPVLVTMGSTRGYIDDVRYVSNYSSGKLGSLIAEELYRLGYATTVVSGPCPVRPRSYGRLVATTTNDEMAEAAAKAMQDGAKAAVLAASVLDFTPKSKTSGKISTADNAELSVPLTRTSKIIAGINPATGVKVGFKLETSLTRERARTLAGKYIADYGLSLMVLNDLADVDEERHKAVVFDGSGGEQEITTKEALALRIAAHVHQKLAPLQGAGVRP